MSFLQNFYKKPPVVNTSNVVPSTQEQLAKSLPKVYPFKFVNQVDEIDLTASAVVDSIELDQRPIAAIILTCKMLGDGAAATIANALTQFGTSLYVSDGGRIITPKFTAAQWYEYYNHFFNKIPAFQDGSAADNKFAKVDLIIPFGRPIFGGNNGLLGLVDPLVGFIPQAIPKLHYSTPADGNSIDTRTMDVTTIYYDGIVPSWSKKWEDYSTITLSTTSYKDWLLPDTGRLLELFLYQTSSYNDTLTSDAPTLKQWKLTQGGNNILTDGAIYNMIGALINSTPTPDDDWLYLPLVEQPVDSLRFTIPLTPNTRFKAKGGVANALGAAFSVIYPAGQVP